MTRHKAQLRWKQCAGWRVRLAALVFWLLPLSAQALTQCSVKAGGVAFGSYIYSNPAATDAVGNVEVSCSFIGLLVSYDIRLGSGRSTNYAPRKMASSAGVLNYNLYTTAGRSTVWDNAASGSSIVSDGYTLGVFPAPRNYPIYGRIPAGQNVPAGVYSDTITVTVNY